MPDSLRSSFCETCASCTHVTWSRIHLAKGPDIRAERGLVHPLLTISVILTKEVNEMMRLRLWLLEYPQHMMAGGGESILTFFVQPMTSQLVFLFWLRSVDPLPPIVSPLLSVVVADYSDEFQLNNSGQSHSLI